MIYRAFLSSIISIEYAPIRLRYSFQQRVQTIASNAAAENLIRRSLSPFTGNNAERSPVVRWISTSG